MKRNFTPPCHNIQTLNRKPTQSYLPKTMKNQIALSFYIHQHEINTHNFTSFSQKPERADSVQITMNPDLHSNKTS